MMDNTMQIENHKENVPFAHYVQLFRQLDPMAAASWLKGIGWNRNQFQLSLLGRTYAISHPEYTIRALDGGGAPPVTVQTFLLRYLTESAPTAFSGGWKTFREMPWGEVYMKAYSGRVLSRAAFTFGKKPDAFRSACEKLGGEPINHGDAGFEIPFLGNYRMRIFIWEGDEEFPPSAQILYSDNFAEGFTAEDRVVAADILISAIKAQM